jgi:hypothetical protein
MGHPVWGLVGDGVEVGEDGVDLFGCLWGFGGEFCCLAGA